MGVPMTDHSVEDTRPSQRAPGLRITTDIRDTASSGYVERASSLRYVESRASSLRYVESFQLPSILARR